ncbi:SDR family oxidoreductase [Acetobacteraceae bacterium KSS8]|uniref:SDR family oxidoreductase n=1 Tax=Endosaccharibacter trunci TaxID=2812733 RepID=A0ABT1W7X2_9PROT|nr:SDR family oxidoreductase [Acetobacteraceae bacterium KSS8]
MTRSPHLLILGLGYSAVAVAEQARAAGYRVTATRRDLSAAAPDGVAVIRPEEAAGVLADATHWLAGAPPGAEGDPFLALLGDAPRGCRPDWIGYFSTTGIYGDRNGDWVDETTEPAPGTVRGQRRLAAERAWSALAARLGARMDLLRLAGIYGPGRSVFDALRDGTSRRIVAPGHAFGRIHRDDIAGATLAAMRRGPAHRVCNLVDDLPAESATVIAYAAGLLGVPPPPEVPLDEALRDMSAMGRSFWSENRKVSGRATQAALGRPWLHPTFREGLAAILREEHLKPRS